MTESVRPLEGAITVYLVYIYQTHNARKRAIRPCTLVLAELSTGTNGSILYRSKNRNLLVPARGSSRY